MKILDFKTSKLPSSSNELEYYWNSFVDDYLNFNKVTINRQLIDFTNSVDYFDITDECADKISYEGRKLDFFSQHIALKEFEMNIFGELSPDTQIGGILSNVAQLRHSAVPYCIYATFKHVHNSVYCAFTIGIADEDTGMELDVAVIEIGQDETPYISPIAINDDVLYYYTFDDIAKISYWLANFWIGIQYKLNHYSEEIRIAEQNKWESENSVPNKKKNNIVLVKRIKYIETDRKGIGKNELKSNRKYTLPAWGVRGHFRTLADGREIPVRPYKKGKERNNPKSYVSKEYEFEDE